MKTLIAMLLLMACMANAASLVKYETMLDHLIAGDQQAANDLYSFESLDPAFKNSIQKGDFFVPCIECLGEGATPGGCDNCRGTGNSSSMAGSKSSCRKCAGSGTYRYTCRPCDGTGNVLDSKALRYLQRRLRYHNKSKSISPLRSWELAKRDLERKRRAMLSPTTIRGEIAQIADGGLFITHSVNYNLVRQFVIGLEISGHYEGESVVCDAWPIGTYTYTSALGASITVQKFTLDLWGDW